MGRKICINDHVVMIAGKDKGKTGKVISVKNKGTKIVVEKLNMIKKHLKGDPNRNIVGGITPKERAVDISNVAIYNVTTKAKDKVKFKSVEGKKKRVFSSTGELVQ